MPESFYSCFSRDKKTVNRQDHYDYHKDFGVLQLFSPQSISKAQCYETFITILVTPKKVSTNREMLTSLVIFFEKVHIFIQHYYCTLPHQYKFKTSQP